jgi:hypothetical protein
MARQMALISRWHDDAIRLSTRLLVAACFDHRRFVRGVNAIEDDLMSFQSLDTEITVEVIDVLHEFCLVFRKLLERAGLRKLASEMYPHEKGAMVTTQAGGSIQQRQLCDKDLWWILGRVIHSKSVMVAGGDETTIHVYADGKSRSFDNGRHYVEVSSDYDSQSGQGHLIHVPSMVRLYTKSNLRMRLDEIVLSNTI